LGERETCRRGVDLDGRIQIKGCSILAKKNQRGMSAARVKPERRSTVKSNLERRKTKVIELQIDAFWGLSSEWGGPQGH